MGICGSSIFGAKSQMFNCQIYLLSQNLRAAPLATRKPHASLNCNS